MKAPLGWLKEFVEIDIPAPELAERLTMAGLEVSEIATERFGLEAARVARVVSKEDHPSKAGLFVLKFDVDGQQLTLVANLPQFGKGSLVPIACEGFQFPDGSTLAPRKMGGVPSEAKILSEADMGVSGRHDVVLTLPPEALPGDCIADLTGISEQVLKFDPTANRGDCLSVFGIARETAAVLGKPLSKTPFDNSTPFPTDSARCQVTIRDRKLCLRYTGRVLLDIRVEQSPVWMQRRLIAAGMRPINNIVDTTNYVLLETGQPLHAFDLDTLEKQKIIVRRAGKGETIQTLDGENRKLTEDMLIIADAGRPVAVAGVMGGAETEVTENTSRLLLESAFFDPASVRRTAGALDLRSEASARFEKSVDLMRVGDCSDRASRLMKELGWGRPVGPMEDVFHGKRSLKKIPVSVNKINSILGTDLDENTVLDTLARLQFKVTGKRALKIEVPSHRPDVSIPEDIAEEVARIYGYNEIPMEMPMVRTHRAITAEGFRMRSTLRGWMSGMGLDEAYCYSLANREEIERIYGGENAPEIVPISNPMAGFDALRPSLLPGLIKAVSHNIAHGNDDVHLFEIGRIFSPGHDEHPEEKDSLAFVITGRGWRFPTRQAAWSRSADYSTAKGIVEDILERLGCGAEFRRSTLNLLHPAKSAEVIVGDEKFAEFGELHPSLLQRMEIDRMVCAGEFSLEKMAPAFDKEKKFKHVSRFPSVPRDLSFIVSEEVQAGKIEKVIREKCGGLLESVEPIDVFRSEAIGRGKKSVTHSLRFRHPERTLDDEEIKQKTDEIISGVGGELGGFLREA
ncbi:MAG: phenylalanine--tRNA ligase subunit beta [bacterium]